MKKPIKIVSKSMKEYGQADTEKRIIYIDPKKNKGMERFDTLIHEKNHIKNPSMSESGIINKTRKEVIKLSGLM